MLSHSKITKVLSMPQRGMSMSAIQQAAMLWVVWEIQSVTGEIGVMHSLRGHTNIVS